MSDNWYNQTLPRHQEQPTFLWTADSTKV